MRKYKWASFGVFILAILSIVALHSYFNLKERITPPSQMWGRDKLIGVTSFKKEPITAYDGKNVNVIFAQDDGFKHAIIDNNGVIKGINGFKVNGYQPDKLMSYQGNNSYMLMLENFDLYYVDLKSNKDSYERHLLLSKIQGFTPLDTEDGTYIAAYDRNSISLYKLEDGTLSKLSDSLQVKDTMYISFKKNVENVFNLAYINEVNSLEYNLMYQDFDAASKKWIPRIKPYMIENLSSYNLNNLQLCFDNEDVYLFYELYKTSPKGLVAQTYMGRMPKNSPSNTDMLFTILNLDEQQYAGASYISSLKCMDEKGDVIQTIMTTPVKSSLKREGNELMYATLDKGKVVDKYLASNTGQWNVDVMINKCGNQYFAFFLETMGRSQYEIRMTSSGEQYKQSANSITQKDLTGAVTDTLSGYIFAVLPIFIGFLLVSPSLLWPIAVDFFEWKKFYYNQDLTFRVGAVLELLFMYININMIYANSEALKYMPDLLKFTGAKFVFLVLTFALAYLITTLYRKGKKEIHIFPQTLIFVFTHLILIYFLFAKYIAGF